MAISASPGPISRNPSPDPLLGTKLHVRPPRSGLVSRLRLLELLDQGLTCPLTLVSAPAGFGKTTLLTEWLKARHHRACWLSLDAADNEPSRFLSYLIAALQTAVPGLAADLAPSLRSPQPPSVEAVVTTLVNEFASIPDQITLVLDDCHLVTSPSVSGALTFLLENLPPNLHLVISTRSDPHMPVARLRARGQVVEVRTDDLRFTPDEAALFLGQTMGLTLSAEQAAALGERTEGWIVGMQMAALSMRGRDDVDAFIQAFAGTNRFILDFLIEEVLSHQPEEIQAFLLQTSVLEQLSAPLCEAVTELPDAQSVLERLERDNLFLVPLDDVRQWYRYHHLFGEVLKTQLARRYPKLPVTLHTRSSEWYEAAGLFVQAFTHAALARDWERARGLLERQWRPMSQMVGSAAVLGFLDMLPETSVRSSPVLSRAYGWLLWLMGRLDQVESHLEDADRAIHEQAEACQSTVEEVERQLPAISSTSPTAALRSHLARHGGDREAAQRYAERALESAPPDNPLVLGAAYLALGHAAFETGQWTRALDSFSRGLGLVKAGGNLVACSITTLYMARIHELRAQLKQAAETCRETLRFAEQGGIARLPAVGVVHLALAEVLAESDEREEAERQLRRGLELARGSEYGEAIKNGALVEARLRRAGGDAIGALGILEQAQAAAWREGNRLAEDEVRAHLVRLRQQVRASDRRALSAPGESGSPEALAKDIAWARGALAGMGERLGYTAGVVLLTLGRLMIACGDADEAREILARALALSEADGLAGFAIQALLLRALASELLGRRMEALSDLGRALTLAEPEGYRRTFLDEGEAVARLLRDGVVRGRWPELTVAFARDLLSRLPNAESTPAEPTWAERRTSPAEASAARLAEPLTQRELEILRLIAQGRSNEEIAELAVISLNTVKRHVSNVFGKLDVRSRTQAVRRGQELGLL